MTILQVIVRDPKDEAILFTEYLEIPPETEPGEVIRAALATAFLSHGIKRGKRRGAELKMRKDDLVAMYVEKQMSTEEIAQVIGNVSDATVGRFLQNCGVKLRKPGRRTFTVSAEMRERVVSLAVDPGRRLTQGEIKQETGQSIYTVRRILREAQVSMPIGRPKK